MVSNEVKIIWNFQRKTFWVSVLNHIRIKNNLWLEIELVFIIDWGSRPTIIDTAETLFTYFSVAAGLEGDILLLDHSLIEIHDT